MLEILSGLDLWPWKCCSLQQCLQVMSCYEPDTTINQHQISIWGICFVFFFLTIVSTSKKGGCGIWEILVVGIHVLQVVLDILRRLHLLFNNRFFSPTKQTWNLKNNSFNQQIFQHFIFLVLRNVLCIGFCGVAKVTGNNVQPKTVGRTLVTRTQQVKSWKEEVTLTYPPWN